MARTIPRQPCGALQRRCPPNLLRTVSRLTVVLASTAIVYCAPAHAAEKTKLAPQSSISSNLALPMLTAEMREAILAAVRSGRLADLKIALELNELKPDVSDERIDDIIAHWQATSTDGSGKEILNILDKVLASNPAIVPLGRDIENNAIYIWPYFAERDLAKLTPTEETELTTLVGSDEAAKLKAAKRWAWYRLAIGADGTWHSFKREK
jgi:hypothetical protein